MNPLMTKSILETASWYRRALSSLPAIAAVFVMAGGIAFAHYGTAFHSMLPQPEQPIPPTYHNGQLIPNPPFPTFGGTPVPTPAPQPPFGPLHPLAENPLNQLLTKVPGITVEPSPIPAGNEGDGIYPPSMGDPSAPPHFGPGGEFVPNEGPGYVPRPTPPYQESPMAPLKPSANPSIAAAL